MASIDSINPAFSEQKIASDHFGIKRIGDLYNPIETIRN